MFRYRQIFVLFALGLFGLVSSSLATNLTSSNAADVVASTSGTPASVYNNWWSTLMSIPSDDTSITGSASCGNQSIGCAATIYANGTFAVTGANGVNSNVITTSASYPLSISMLNTPALTGLLLDITGLASVTLTLSDGSTVSTDATTYTTPTYVTFISPLQITAASIFFGSSGSLSDLSWGTANIADLPTQPGSGGGSGTSGTPEPATMLLMAGGLLAISRLMKKHSFSF